MRLNISTLALKSSCHRGPSGTARRPGGNHRALAAAMLFLPPGHVGPGCRHGVPNLGPAPASELPRAFGVALFTNVGKRLLEIRVAGSVFLALTRIFLRDFLPSISRLPSFNLKQQ